MLFKKNLNSKIAIMDMFDTGPVGLPPSRLLHRLWGADLRWVVVGLAGLILATSVWAVDPRVRAVLPPGGQAGSEMELRLEGERLGDAQAILFYEPGFEVRKLEEIQPNLVRATLVIGTDCAWGEHHLRLRTATGLSELHTFYVGPFPVAAKETGRKPEDPAQTLPLNVTVSGSVANETVDRYRVEAKRGQRLSAEVECMRLGRDFNDPYVSIVDGQGRILARSDDTALFVQDGFASALVPEDGFYFVEVRETSYGALGLYRLHVGTFPRPLAVYPPGGPAQTELTVRLIDPVGGDFTQAVTLPEPSWHDFGIFAQQDGVAAPSWNRLRIARFPNVLEAEPNNSAAQATVASNALPLAFNGILEQPRDEDWFRFTARKDETFDVQVYARSLRSPLDSVLVVANHQGQGIASNDDSGGPDSYLRFKVPEEGDYTVRITDHLGNGGPDYTYRVEIAPVTPALSLYVPDVSQYDTQTRKSVVVARGNRFPLIVNARRKDVGGELVLGAADLPPGIELHADKLAANLDSLMTVWEAAADAPVGGRLSRLTVRLEDAQRDPPLTGGLWQNFDLVQRGNQGVYYQTWVDQMAVAVVEELPFRIRLEEPKAPLVREGNYPLKVVAERNPDFQEPIKVQFPVRPPGVNCPTEITLAKDQSEAFYNLSANGNAEIKEHRIALVGFAAVQGGTAYVASQLATLQVTESFVEGKIPLAATIQGNPTQVKCELTHKFPFEGKAKVELVGLPPGASTEPREITRDDPEVVFDIAIAADARTGVHRTLFCQMTVTYRDEILTQSFGGRGTLRIDPPPPPPEPEETEPKPAAAVQAASAPGAQP